MVGEKKWQGLIAELEAAIKQRDELAAEVKSLTVARDIMGNLWSMVKAERDDALAQAAAAAIDMREMCANASFPKNWREYPTYKSATVHQELYAEGFNACLAVIRALEPTPDQQQALDDALAKAWEDGYTDCCNGQDNNPYRKREQN